MAWPRNAAIAYPLPFAPFSSLFFPFLSFSFFPFFCFVVCFLALGFYVFCSSLDVLLSFLLFLLAMKVRIPTYFVYVSLLRFVYPFFVSLHVSCFVAALLFDVASSALSLFCGGRKAHPRNAVSKRCVVLCLFRV